MLSSWVEPVDLVSIKVNMIWDGLFHAFTWLVTVAGVALLWRAARRADVPWSGKAFVGALSLGRGLFNVVEGVIDHHALGVHHVHPGAGQLAWDLGFLICGSVLAAGGWATIRGAQATDAGRMPSASRP